MYLGLNLNLGNGGGVLRPADPDLILQSLRDNDGQIVLDFIDPKVVDPEPEYTGVNCLEFESTTPTSVYFPCNNTFKVGDRLSCGVIIDTPPAVDGFIFGSRVLNAGTDSKWVNVGYQSDGTLRLAVCDGISSSGVNSAVPYDLSDGALLEVVGTASGFDLEVDGVVAVSNNAAGFVNILEDNPYIRVNGYGADGEVVEPLDMKCFHLSAPCLESPMSNQLPYDVSGNGNDAISSTGVLTTADGIPSSNLLYGYTPSIIGDGSGQCINFGIIPDATTKVELTFANDSVSAAFRPMIGCFNGGFSARFLLARTSSGFVYYYANISNVPIGAQDAGVRHTATLEYDLATFDGVEYPFTSLGLSGATTPIQMYCIDWNGVDYNEYLEAFRVRIWHQGSLAVDAIPINDGQFYDKVTKTIIGNSGTGNLVTEYYPALKEPTVAVATFDGVADKLLVPEITGLETLSYSGSAALRVNAGEITAFSGLGGTAYNITINGELVYSITDLIGKTNTTIPSLSENYSDAQVVTGAGGLDAFWARRIEDTVNGVLVDATYESDNLIYGRTQYGQMIHNGCEVKITQQDTDYAVFGAGDTIYGNGVDTWNAVAWSDYKLHPNGSMGGYGKWVKDANGNCILERFDQYDKDYAPTPTGYRQNLNFYKTGTCGAAPLEAVTDSGEIVTDNGLVVFDGGA